jgi:hypothetical protein
MFLSSAVVCERDIRRMLIRMSTERHTAIRCIDIGTPHALLSSTGVESEPTVGWVRLLKPSLDRK